VNGGATGQTAPRRAIWTAGLLLALCAALAVFCALKLKVVSDITHFLPDDSDAVTARLLRGLSTANVAQRTVLILGGAPAEVLTEASARIAAGLRAEPAIAGVERAVDDDAQKQLYELYFPHRYGMFSAEPERDYAALLSDAGLASAAGELVRRLGSADGAFVRKLAPEDPLLIFPRIVSRLDGARRGGLSVRDGVFFTNDGRRAVLFVRSRASALDAPEQRIVLGLIDREVAEARAALHAPLTVEKSGVGRYSVHAEQAVRADIERISVLSSVIIVAMVLLTLRSFRALLLVTIPTLFGAVFACAATLLIFGRIHGMTLAFGTTLLGVCSDYPAHLIGHHLLAPKGQQGSVTARAIWPAIRLGGLTTVAGLAGLGIAGFPGIRELAVFSAVGVLASLVATHRVVPVALGAGGAASGSTRALADWLAAGIRAVERRTALCWGLLAIALLLCVIGFSSLRFQDDLASWLPMPQALRSEDERVNASLLATDPGKLVVVAADSVDSALAANDRVAGALNAAIAAGALADYRGLHTLIWAPALQQRNLTALRAAPQLPARTLAAFEAAGVDAAQLAPFARAIASLPPPLTLKALLDSPLAPVASGFVLDDVETKHPPLLLTHLRGVRDPRALERALAAIPQARYFDQRTVLSTTYAAFRARAFELLAGGLFAVLGMVLARYRSLRRSLAAITPAVLASAATLSVLTMFGVRLDLFHVLGVLIVLSMGEDCGVFLVENDGGEDLPATALGIALACASTVASFGLLALSDIPALRSLGQVVSIGVLLATVFAPAGLVLLDRTARAERGHL
jgi:predicted exporter